MAVDGGDNVHLAYYDVFNGGLHYAYIPALNGNTTTARPDKSSIKTAKVDTYLSAGTKIMINVRKENHNGTDRYVPYISYFHTSFGETRNSIRVAWPKVNVKTTPQISLQGTDGNDRFTGNWEVMTVPTQTVPLAEQFICNGVPESSTKWGGSLPPGSDLVYTGIDKSILVSYMTTDWYEGAALKYNIITSPGQE